MKAEIRFTANVEDIKELLEKITREEPKKKPKPRELYTKLNEFITMVFGVGSPQALDDTQLILSQKDIFYAIEDFIDYVNGATIEDLREKNRKRQIIRAQEMAAKKKGIY